MAAKWVKAVFLAIIGIVIIFYTDSFVTELKDETATSLDLYFDETWTLLMLLMYILGVWLLVDAVLTVATSLKGEVYGLSDVMERLKRIEKTLGHEEHEPSAEELEPEIKAVPVKTEEEVPPPPAE
jgi:hypothetical protein